MSVRYPQATQYRVPYEYPGGYVNYGRLAAIEPIYSSDIRKNLSARGYYKTITTPPVTPPPVTPPPAFTKAQAVACGVSKSLNTYGYSATCKQTRCSIPGSKYDTIVTYAVTMSKNAQARGLCPWTFSGLFGLGQVGPEGPLPDLSFWDKHGAAILGLFGAGLTWASDYKSAQQVQQKLTEIATAQGLSPTRADIGQLVAAAFAAYPQQTGGDRPAEAAAFPDWAKYGLIAGGAVLVVTMLKK